MKPPLIILTGPTAVGKTALSIALAKAISGEIISADSMQVYRHMDIGSAKITKKEMCGVVHHLIDVLEPTDPFDVTIFQQMAKKALSDIYANGHIPIVVGGTGFYIQALLYNIDFKEQDNTSIRTELEVLGKEKGCEYMHQLLEQIDPDSAVLIHANNEKRVIRAIEYFRLTGEKISVHNRLEQQKESPYQFVYYVLNTARPILYQRINDRIETMLKDGLIDEVQHLKEIGCTRTMCSMQGLGYKEILDYLDGKTTLEEAIYILKRDTRHFAKRQITWFKREKEVRWLDPSDYHRNSASLLEQMKKEIKEKLEIEL